MSRYIMKFHHYTFEHDSKKEIFKISGYYKQLCILTRIVRGNRAQQGKERSNVVFLTQKEEVEKV